MTTKHLPNGQVEIHTSRLLLRAAREEDLTDLYEAFRDPKVMRYWSELPHPNIEHTREWLGKMISSDANGRTNFVVVLKSTGTTIGKMGIWQTNEIGFLFHSSYWRVGIGREALEAVLAYSFGEKGFDAVTADAYPENEASIGLLTRVGFEITGFEEKIQQVAGTWVDSCYLELKREKWKRGEVEDAR